MSNTPLGVLLVQDSPQTAQRLQAMLADAGPAQFEVTVAHSLKDALAIVASRRFHAIVLDPALPDSEGLEAIQRIDAAIVPEIPIVMVSESGDEALALQAVRAGAQNSLIADQITAPLLRQTIRCAVERRLFRQERDRKRFEQVLRENERYRELTALLPQIVYETDCRGKITFANRSSLTMFRYTEEELATGLNVMQMLIPADHARAKENFGKAMRGETDLGTGTEYTALRKDGSTFPCLIFSSPIMQDGAAMGLRGIIIDLTEQKEAQFQLHQREEQLRQAQKMEAIGLLAGGVAHDFRNQLTVIKGYAELILRRELTQEPSREYIQEILQAAERSATLSGQLLAFSRRQTLRPEVLNIDDLIGGMAKSLARMIGEHIRLSVARSANLGSVRIDPGQFQQALINLAVNARDAMPQGGRLTIETANADLDADAARLHAGARPGPYVMVTVGDTGVGMDHDTMGRIFEPFFTTKPVGHGTGLGLPMVYGFVSQSGGHITVSSQPGRGATFRLFLPRLEQAAEPATPGPESLSKLIRGIGTILVVEDEDAIRHFLAQTLRDCGYTVLEAGNAQEAVPLGEHYDNQIDLLISDVVMPGMNGVDLARALKPARPEMQVLYVSGYAGNMLSQRGVLEQHVNLLVKPIDSYTLTETVHRLISKAPPPA